MAHNSLYPGFVKISYSTSLLEHKMVLPCLPFLSIADTWFVEQKAGGAGQLWTSAVDAFVALIRPFFSTASTTVHSAELWTYDDPEGDPIFREVHEVDLTGSSGTAAQLMSQSVLTQRTAAGGILRSYFMEQVHPPNGVYAPPAFTGYTGMTAFVTYMQGNTAWVVGRDGTFPIAAVRLRTKTNDALRRKRQLFS